MSGSGEQFRELVGEISGYRIVEPLGYGGFSTVFKATQISTGQDVAVKVLQLPSTLDEAARRRKVERFQRETQLCAQLNHPHIVRLLDKGVDRDDKLFAVFEYVPGETLEQLIKRNGPLSAVRAGELMSQVLDALACAHGNGIVHRDLKPQNIMVTTTGVRSHAKVLDFGIGTILADRHQLGVSNLTMTRETLGTPSYSAPEQLRGEPTTLKSDIYAWGLSFLECLTGRPVIQGDTLAQIYHKQLSPNPIPLPPGLAAHPVARLLHKVLCKDPQERADDVTTLFNEFSTLDLSTLVGSLSHNMGNNDAGAGVGYTRTRTMIAENPVQVLDNQRRQLTVMCCSLVVAAEQGAAIDLEALDAIQSDQMQLSAQTATRYGGHVSGTMGEQLMIFFGYPYVSDNDARRAARTALELSTQISRRSSLLQKQQGFRLELRIGLHTGPVLIRRNNTPTGPAANVALRLVGMAQAGEILVSDTTRQLLRLHIEFDQSNLRIKDGANVEHIVYQMVGERHSEALSFFRDGGGGQEFIGRDEEMNQLLAAAEMSRRGKGQVLLLQGEPGIGKSRLAFEFRQRHLQQGGVSHDSRCLPEHRNNSLYPFLEFLRNLLNWRDGTDQTEVVGKLESILSGCGSRLEWTMPIFCSWLSLSLRERFEVLTLSPDRQKQILIESVSRLIVYLARREPLLFIIEDIHWIDPTSLDLLTQLINDVQGSAIAILLTARQEFPNPWPEEKVQHLSVANLSNDDTEVMVHNILGGRPVSAHTLQSIVERVDGIPLFIEEVTRMLLDRQLLHEVDGVFTLVDELAGKSIPITLQDSLNSRLERLGAAAETAQMAAAIGREFDYALLASISLRDESLLQADLDSLQGADLIYRVRNVHGESFIFRHALIRDAAYAGVPESRLRWLHTRIGERLEAEFPARIEAAPQIVAHHFDLGGQHDKAHDYWLRAGHKALRESAYDESGAHLRRGLTSLMNLPDGEERDNSQLDLLNALGASLINKYGYGNSEVVATFAKADDLLKKNTATPERQFMTRWGLFVYNHIKPALANAAQMGEELFAQAKLQENRVFTLGAHSALCRTYICMAKHEQAIWHGEACERFYDANVDAGSIVNFGDDPLVITRSFMALSLLLTGRVDEAVACHDRALAHARHLGLPSAIAPMLGQSAWVHLVRGTQDLPDSPDLQIAADYASQAISMSAEYGLPLWQSYGQVLLAIVHILRGEGTDLDAVRAGMNMWQWAGAGLGRGWQFAYLADGLRMQGDIAGALEVYTQALQHMEESQEYFFQAELHRFRARLYLPGFSATPDPDKAEQELRTALAIARSQQETLFEVRAASDLFQLCSDQGRSDEVLPDLAQAYARWQEIGQGGGLKSMLAIKTVLEAHSDVVVDEV